MSLVSDQGRKKIVDACSIREADAGKILYRAGDPPNGLYCLLSGSVRMDTLQSPHGPTLLGLFHTGAWLGEVEMFSSVGRVVTLSALRPIQYAHIPASSVETIGDEHPEIWRALGHLAAEKVCLAVAGLDDLMIRSSTQRLSAVLLRLCGARLDIPFGEIATELDVTQSELAQLANLSRGMVGRMLDSMEKDGQIERRYGRISIIEIEDLKKRLTDEST